VIYDRSCLHEVALCKPWLAQRTSNFSVDESQYLYSTAYESFSFHATDGTALTMSVMM